MSLLRVVPTASLAIVALVLGSALLIDRGANFPFTEPPEGASLARVDLGLGDVTLRGQVVDEQGAPVPDAGITAYQAGRPLWTWTRADGTFELAELEAGALRVLVNGIGFEATAFDLDGVDTPAADERQRFVLDERISEPPDPPGLRMAPLSGVIDFDEGADASRGYEVLLMPTTAPDDPDGGIPCRQTVGADGTFEFEAVHAGRYRVILLSPEDRGGTGPDLAMRADGSEWTFEHAVGGDAPSLDVISRAGRIRGVLFSPVTVDGVEEARPIRGGLVRAEPLAAVEREDDPLRGATFRAQRTDEGGRYVLRDLAPGRYRVTVVAGPMRETFEVDVPERESVDLDVQAP